MYLEITFKRTFYLQIGREVTKLHWCAYLISWGELYKKDSGEVEFATLYGVFSSLNR